MLKRLHQTWLGTRQQLANVDMSPLQLKDQLILPLDKVHDHGVILDSRLNMESHVENVVRSSFYQLRQRRCIRCSLNTDARRTLATRGVQRHPRRRKMRHRNPRGGQK